MSEAPSSEWRSLAPASVLVNLVPDLWRTARAFWPVFLALVLGGAPIVGSNLGLVLVFFAAAAGRTLLHFLTLRYRLHDGRLEIRSGLLARQFRSIDPARIQNVEIVQNLFHKAAGLVELRVDTAAGDGGAEGLLSAIEVPEAEALRAALYRTRPGAADLAQGTVLLEVSPMELVGYGLSAGRIGAAILTAGVVFEYGSAFAPSFVQKAIENASSLVMVGLALVAMAIAYALSAASAVLRYQAFRLLATPGGVRLESGFFTRRGVDIPYGKVQAVRIDEPLVRRWMGYASVHVETAAGAAPSDTPTGEGFIPMVAEDELEPAVRHVIPGVDLDPSRPDLSPPAPRALLGGAVSASLFWAFAAGAGAWWVGTPWLLLLVAVGPALAYADWRTQGWRVSGRTVVARRGFMRRSTWILPRSKVQSVHLSATWFQRVTGLAVVEVWVAGTRVELPDLRAEDARRVFDTLAADAAARVARR